MSVINGNSPELIVKNGLVLNLDAGNRNSYISGTDAWYDLSGNNINGNIISASFLAMPTFNSYNGGSLTFDGADDAANASISGSVEFSEFTVNAWIRLSSSTTSGTHAAVGALLNAFRLGVFNNYKLMFGVNSSLSVGLTIPNTPTLETGSWYMITGVLGQSTLTAYLNGNFAASTSSFISSVRPPSEFNLVFIGYGFRSNAWLFRGDIAQVQLYGRALSASEILQNYNANKSRFTTSSLAVSTVPKIPTDGLVFDLDAANAESYAGSGNTWYDLSGNNNNGTLTNGPTYNSANKGSIAFDGVNDSVIVPNSSTIGITGDMTIVSWIKATNFTSERSIVGKTPSSIPAPYDFYLGIGGNPKFFRGNGSVYNNVNATNAPAVNTWQNVCVTMAGTSVVHYLNGNVNSTGTLSTTIANDPASSLYVGNRADGGVRMLGNIGLVLIYNRALSAQEMRSIYNATKGRYGI